MLPEATVVDEWLPGCFRWQMFSPAHKVELTAHAVRTPSGLFVFDPIPLAPAAHKQLLAANDLRAIILTNANHERDAAVWRTKSDAPIFAAHLRNLELADVQLLPTPPTRWHEWEITPLDGGAPGEIALRWRERSLVIFGDAMFNLPNYGLDVLPEKYCCDHAQLRIQLREVCRVPFDLALFAHGEPLTHNASRQILGRL